MIRFLDVKTIVILLIIPQTLLAEIYNYPITRVIDGDTVEISVDFLPKPLKPKMSIRLVGIDTPESKRPKCLAEGRLGQKAKEYTTQIVKNAKTTAIIISDWDKYGSRLLGDVLIDNKSLAKMLIDNHYAISYDGKKKHNWCR